MEYDIEVDLLGGTTYYKKGTTIIHREDGPAIIWANGSKFWIVENKYHRENGPTIEWFEGDEVLYSWHIRGERLSPEKEAVLNKWWKTKNAL